MELILWLMAAYAMICVAVYLRQPSVSVYVFS